MAKILIVDTNRAMIPVWEFLTGKGHEVWVVGGRSDEPLAKHNDKYIKQDYSCADTLRRLVLEGGYDYIVPGCTDASYVSCSQLSDLYPSLESQENTHYLTDKIAFKDIAESLGLSVARRMALADLKEVPRVIVKPADGYSGRGVTTIDTSDGSATQSAIEVAIKHSRSGAFLIEEHKTGQLYSCSAFITRGQVQRSFFVHEDSISNPYTVDYSYLADDLSESVKKNVIDEIECLSRYLDLKDGLFHIQFISERDEYTLIECTRRCPGDLYSELIEYSTGYRYAQRYASQFVPEEANDFDSVGVQEEIVRHTVTAASNGRYLGISFADAAKIKYFLPMCAAGDVLHAGDRVGVAFFEVSDSVERARVYTSIRNGGFYTLFKRELP
ncbi:ATP-grasp domain-containing protein [Salinicola tamaricis]|uniref:ATP-grasp domain-containing protein n=1 Tax=Salinicola tamaricis TaxID=1771309 RepID=UPI000D09A16C|nr:ATP-grasp domain-containing protein [Salinicola tamaricis]